MRSEPLPEQRPWSQRRPPSARSAARLSGRAPSWRGSGSSTLERTTAPESGGPADRGRRTTSGSLFSAWPMRIRGVGVHQDPPISLASGQSVFEVVGTSLHNLSMPLIRYRTGDLVIVDSAQRRCACQREFPLVHSIVGRDSDIVVTPDKRAVTALYVALDRLSGFTCGQIVQETPDTLVVKIVGDCTDDSGLQRAIVETVRSFTGSSMKIFVRNCGLDELRAGGGKFKSIVSHVDPLTMLQ
jgi:hypothetical protein